MLGDLLPLSNLNTLFSVGYRFVFRKRPSLRPKRNANAVSIGNQSRKDATGNASDGSRATSWTTCTTQPHLQGARLVFVYDEGMCALRKR